MGPVGLRILDRGFGKSAIRNLQSEIEGSLTHRGAFEEGAQHTAPGRMPQLPKGLGLDLADALARDRETLAYFLQCVFASVPQTKPHLDDLLLARCQRLQDRFRLLF